MHDGMPYGQNQGQGHSREVDRQSPTGLIFKTNFNLKSCHVQLTCKYDIISISLLRVRPVTIHIGLATQSPLINGRVLEMLMIYIFTVHDF